MFCRNRDGGRGGSGEGFGGRELCLGVCVCLCVYMGVCGRFRQTRSAKIFEGGWGTALVTCVCVCACVCMCVCVCVQRPSVCVHVWVRVSVPAMLG